MADLGEAYIDVHANTDKFEAELIAKVNAAIKAAEKKIRDLHVNADVEGGSAAKAATAASKAVQKASNESAKVQIRNENKVTDAVIKGAKDRLAAQEAAHKAAEKSFEKSKDAEIESNKAARAALIEASAANAKALETAKKIETIRKRGQTPSDATLQADLDASAAAKRLNAISVEAEAVARLANEKRNAHELEQSASYSRVAQIKKEVAALEDAAKRGISADQVALDFANERFEREKKNYDTIFKQAERNVNQRIEATAALKKASDDSENTQLDMARRVDATNEMYSQQGTLRDLDRARKAIALAEQEAKEKYQIALHAQQDAQKLVDREVSDRLAADKKIASSSRDAAAQRALIAATTTPGRPSDEGLPTNAADAVRQAKAEDAAAKRAEKSAERVAIARIKAEEKANTAILRAQVVAADKAKKLSASVAAAKVKDAETAATAARKAVEDDLKQVDKDTANLLRNAEGDLKRSASSVKADADRIKRLEAFGRAAAKVEANRGALIDRINNDIKKDDDARVDRLAAFGRAATKAAAKQGQLNDRLTTQNEKDDAARIARLRAFGAAATKATEAATKARRDAVIAENRAGASDRSRASEGFIGPLNRPGSAGNTEGDARLAAATARATRAQRDLNDAIRAGTRNLNEETLAAIRLAAANAAAARAAERSAAFDRNGGGTRVPGGGGGGNDGGLPGGNGRNDGDSTAKNIKDIGKNAGLAGQVVIALTGNVSRLAQQNPAVFAVAVSIAAIGAAALAAVAAAGALATALVAVGAFGASQIQDASKAFAAFTPEALGTKDVESLTKALRGLSVETGQTLPALSKVAQTFIGVGASGAGAIAATEQIVKAFDATGVSGKKAETAISGLAQTLRNVEGPDTFIKTLEDINKQLPQFTPDVFLTQLGKALGLADPQLDKTRKKVEGLVESGKVSRKDFLAGISGSLDDIAKRTEKAPDSLLDTLLKSFSKIKDTIGGATLESPGFAALTDQITGFVDRVLPQLATLTSKAFDAFGPLVAKTFAAVEQLIPKLGELFTVAAKITGAVITSIAAILKFGVVIVELFQNKAQQFKDFFAGLGTIFTALAPVVGVVKLAFDAIADILGVVGRVVQKLGPTLKILGAVAALALANFLRPLFAIRTALEFLEPLILKIADVVNFVFKNVATVIFKTVDAILSVVLGAIKTFNKIPLVPNIPTDGIENAIDQFGILKDKIDGIPRDVAVNVSVNAQGLFIGDEGFGVGNVDALNAELQRQLDSIAADKAKPDFGGGTGGFGNDEAAAAAKTAANELKTKLKKVSGDLKKLLTDIQKQDAKSIKDFLQGTLLPDLRAAGASTKLIDFVKRENGKLLDLARQRDKITARLEKAKEAFNAAFDAARATGSITSISDSLLDLASSTDKANGQLSDLSRLRIIRPGEDLITSILGSAEANRKSLVASRNTLVQGLQDRLAALKKFNADIKILIAKGLNKTQIQDILNAGVEGGGATADLLAGASSKTIASLNKTQKELDAQAKQLGSIAGDVAASTGEQVVLGIVKGLKEQKSALSKAIGDLVTVIIKRIKKDLDIKSPSRVMAKIGAHAVDGLAKGLGDHASVSAAASSLATSASDAAGALNLKTPTLSILAELNSKAVQDQLAALKGSSVDVGVKGEMPKKPNNVLSYGGPAERPVAVTTNNREINAPMNFTINAPPGMDPHAVAHLISQRVVKGVSR